MVERIAAINDWSFERAGDDEITILVGGKWSDYQVSFTWMHDIEALHLACAFDLKVPERRRGEVQQLIALINEQMWVGHFDLWTKDGMVMFRHALVLAGGVEADEPAMPGDALHRAEGLRRLFPGLPVRGLGRQARARGARRRHVRDLGRGLGPTFPTIGLSCPAQAGHPVIAFADCPAIAHGFATIAITGSSACADDDAEASSWPNQQSSNSLAAIPGTLVLVGAGKMGGAMLDGWLARKLPPKKVVVLEPQPSKAIKALAGRGVRINPKGEVGHVAALVVAVKPQIAPDALPPLAALVGPRPSWSRSWPGGRSAFSNGTCPDAAIVRAMPNTPAAIGRGITVAVAQRRVTRRRASSRTACSPRPARSNGSTTRR